MNDLFSPPTADELQAVKEPFKVIQGIQEVETYLNMPDAALAQYLALPDGVYENIPEEYYHKLPYCSSTYLRKLANNPAAAAIPFHATSSMNIGSAVHKWVLEGKVAFNDHYYCMPDIAHHKNSNAYKAELIECQHASGGRELVDSNQLEIIIGCAKSVMEHPIAKKLLLPTLGQPEVSIIFTDPETGLRGKARIDRLPDSQKRAAIDLKTSADASLLGFGRSITKYGYHIQAAYYLHALRTAGIEADAFIFVVVETKPPYQVLTGMLDPDFLLIGDMEVRRLLNIEKECHELGFFPNIQIPGHIPSLFDIYNQDGTIKNDNDLFEIFTAPKWMI